MYPTGHPFAQATRAYGYYSPMVAFGVDAAAPDPNSLTEKAKAWLGAQNSVVPVKNGYIVAGAAVLGIGLYAGWFGTRRRRG
jgi:hypothetical protein